jgi:hypothetical protein
MFAVNRCEMMVAIRSIPSLFIIFNCHAIFHISGTLCKTPVQVFDTLHLGLFEVFSFSRDAEVVELVISHILGDALVHWTS